MPTQALLHAAIESAINKALDWSYNGHELTAPLLGKRVIMHLQKIDFVCKFDFAGSGVVVSGDDSDVYCSLPDDLQENECWISVSLSAVDKLKSSHNLTQLIKKGALDFAGDLQILQSFSSLFNKLELDFEEVLSRYIGDVPAYQASQNAQQLFKFGKQSFEQLATTLSDAALDEKNIAVRKIMVINFSDEVKQVSQAYERLEARLTLLENKRVDE